MSGRRNVQFLAKFMGQPNGESSELGYLRRHEVMLAEGLVKLVLRDLDSKKIKRNGQPPGAMIGT